jgi:aspartate kinase
MVRVITTSLADRPGVAAGVFTWLSEAGFNVEVFSQTGSAVGHWDLALVIEESESNRILEFLQGHLEEIGARGILLERDLAMAGFLGHLLASTTGAAGQIFGIRGNLGINIEVTGADPVSMVLMLPRAQGQRAYEAVRDAFGLKHHRSRRDAPWTAFVVLSPRPGGPDGFRGFVRTQVHPDGESNAAESS